MSKYVNRMKDVLVSLNTTVLEIHRKMDYNNQHFQADYASEENARLQAEVNRAADQAREQVDSIRKEAVAAAKTWAEIDGKNIDTADMSLLKGDFCLSAEDLHNLMVKHQGNSVMVNAIAKYANDHDVAMEHVPNLNDKLLAYNSFAQSANRVISDIVGNIGLSSGCISLTEWAKPSNISQRMETILYGIKKHEPAAEATPKGTFNFGFRPLSGR